MEPQVFVSYSHDSNDHKQWVAQLGANLRVNGVNASLDQWDLQVGQDTTFFMESQIRNSDFVVLVCTPTYAQKSNIPRGGVGYEKNIISAEMLQSRDLRPKFLPVLRQGTHEDALPTYLGSKFAIDFRESSSYKEALEELLRAILGQPHPGKPPLGKNPFLKENTTNASSGDTLLQPDIKIWEKEALGRFEFLRKSRIKSEDTNSFKYGYWQASFVLTKQVAETTLRDFLEKLRASVTNRTGWNIGWVPSRDKIAPYPYKDGIEVWLADRDYIDPGHSDFWRAELSGRFSLFRGYQEDGTDFPKSHPGTILAFDLMLWRISEFLLYIENFAKQLGVPDSGAILKVTWNGLENRKIAHHKERVDEDHICLQENVSSTYQIENCANIKRTLIRDVHLITKRLFETFDFFSVTEEEIKYHIKGLFDPNKELSQEQV